MKAISGKRLARLLEQRGWTLARVSGSHHIYTRSGSEIRITVPIHGNQSLKTGLQRHLMKLAGIAEADL
jgi:predicted RNA binding protein YcfA (HicA-like mRNA interferase family)